LHLCNSKQGADIGWFYPDQDPTSEEKPDPTVEKKNTVPILEKEPGSRSYLILILKNSSFTFFGQQILQEKLNFRGFLKLDVQT